MNDFPCNKNECGMKNVLHKELSLQWAIETYQLMQIRGVVLYGGGKEGLLALETLKHEGIHVNAVADQCVGKKVGDKVSISIAELCAQGKNEVCIVTPLKVGGGGRAGIKKIF